MKKCKKKVGIGGGNDKLLVKSAKAKKTAMGISKSVLGKKTSSTTAKRKARIGKILKKIDG